MTPHSRLALCLPVQKNTHYMMIFDAFVILTCLSSLVLCARSVIRGIQLQQVGRYSPRCRPHHAQSQGSSHCLSSSPKEFVNFFLLHYKKEVSTSDQMEFINGWYIMIIISDILTIVGSILKMEIQAKVKTVLPNCATTVAKCIFPNYEEIQSKCFVLQFTFS